MQRIIAVFLMVCSLVSFFTVQAAAKETTPTKPAIWEMDIYNQDKLSPEEEEQARWSAVFANDMGLYLLDTKSLAMVEGQKDTVTLLAKTLFNNPKIVARLNEMYKTQLKQQEHVAYSAMQMRFLVNKRKYAVLESKVYGNKGTLLYTSKAESVQFKEVPVKTFADSLYEIAKAFARTH